MVSGMAMAVSFESTARENQIAAAQGLRPRRGNA